MLTHWILIYPLDSAIHQLFEQLEPVQQLGPGKVKLKMD